MSQEQNSILGKMLERLFAAVANGPSLNCKPYSSRQRVDFSQFSKLGDLPPEQMLRELLGEAASTKVLARVPAPRKRGSQTASLGHSEELTEAERQAQQKWNEQQAIVGKVRTIAEDARTYENDTGVHVLHIGFPLISLPPGSFGLQTSFTRRILAPIAFISVHLTLRGGASPAVVMECANAGEDRVTPNTALLAWLEQQTGQSAAETADEANQPPWAEIAAIVERLAKAMDIPRPEVFTEASLAEKLMLQPSPRTEDQDARPGIICSAILGLFPMSNQGLLRDTQALLQGEPLSGPAQSFLNVDAILATTAAPQRPAAEPAARVPRNFSEERLVSAADPCQSRAVKLARTCKGLVVHGPPGTGKSQTITNIIGDHLARGQRVLLVCDKRTALDVVMHRLESLGMGSLCAVVHDPRRDQRDLYKSIRAQLDELPDVKTNARADENLQRTDLELQKLHDELSEYHAALMEDHVTGDHSFHALIGDWLRLPSHEVEIEEPVLNGISPADCELHLQDVGDVLQRAETCAYPTNPWRAAAGVALADLLSIAMDRLKERLGANAAAAETADATRDPSIPPFAAEADLSATSQQREALASRLKHVLAKVEPAVLARWAHVETGAVRRERERFADLAPLIELFRSAPLDAELALAARAALPGLAAIGQQTALLDQYLAIAAKWYAILCFRQRAAAAPILSRHGLALSADNAARVRKFLLAVRARLILQGLRDELLQQPGSSGLSDDSAVEAFISSHLSLFDLQLQVADSPALSDLAPLLAEALSDPAAGARFVAGLEKSAPRAAALARLEQSLEQSRLYEGGWLSSFNAAGRSGGSGAETCHALRDALPALEGVLRVREGLAKLPSALSAALTTLLEASIDAQSGVLILKKGVLAQEIARRLRANPSLQGADAQKLRSSFERYRLLDQQKKSLVRDAIMHHWVGRQKQRLLAATGSRLNGSGAEARRRLTIRGERAMRLRQVVAAGQNGEQPDPLFDLRPVWMASPETVAQVFPRKALFELVIFDEASQCRLEEALPVLTRGERLVVAGDPRQLPPTRFFESALAASEEEEIETDQQLFEAQQGEIEDLLSAALNIEIQECYLDVHYRSRNADLIEFSNQHFYQSRLQSIPAHPSHRARFAPLTLYRVDGVYEKRCNLAEAQRVCQIVQDLLRRAAPPSIGIACFNLPQRDAIVEKLDDLAEEDPQFGRKLAEQRVRRGQGSFEGLFVKNLESVQGDERDHIIISTTYGPDPQGKFHRRFGPLGRAGGGRRLNVLVTRAREEVHLVTSIPPGLCRSLPPVPPGEAPGGAWLLFSYLAYAERLAEQYESQHRALEQMAPEERATVNVRPTRWPSEFSRAYGYRLADQHNIGSDIHWGNDGFCVDLALHHPTRAEDVTVGVICDLTRFAQAEDPVEWEIFRTAILESQGWRLHRLWSPHFFRDHLGVTQSLLNEVAAALSSEAAPDAIRVVDGPAQS